MSQNAMQTRLDSELQDDVRDGVDGDISTEADCRGKEDIRMTT